jgi:hypothetical protein
MTMELAPAPAETATCANCSAPLVADQRYCLSCGQPCSPVRLAFLDVLQGDGQSQTAGGRALATTQVAYAPLLEPTAGGPGWLRRYSPLFGALTVLLLAMIAGLLVGHWVTQRNSPTTVASTPETIKIEGLGGLGAAASSTTPTATTPASTTSTPASSAKEEAAEVVKEAKTEKAQAKKAEKATTIKRDSLKKLDKTSGKKHEEEVNSLGAQPIETG